MPTKSLLVIKIASAETRWAATKQLYVGPSTIEPNKRFISVMPRSTARAAGAYMEVNGGEAA